MNTNENPDETNDHQGDKIHSSGIALRLIKAINEDEQINSSRLFNFTALKDNLPEICQTIVELVTSNKPNLESSLDLHVAGLDGQGTKHGYTRWKQNFAPEEVVREFFLLKKILIAELKPELLTNS